MSTYTSYDECDKKFIKDYFMLNYEGFMPIWATENISEVTKFWNSNGSRMHLYRYRKIYKGDMDSGKALNIKESEHRTSNIK